ncbi:cytochrome P450 [Stipitochalara longipes BDJ]|nr:cytochrome P450 [Stipitochalara longipes BDJ]
MVVANTAARVFVGPVFPHEWIFASIHYIRDVFYAVHFLKIWPEQLRFFFKYLNPSMWRQWKHINTAARVVKESLLHPASGYATPGINSKLPEDKKRDYVFQGRAQLGFAVATIHPTVRVICQVLFDLAEHPEYIPTLRAEIKAVLGARRLLDKETWTVDNLALLKKLDSVMKESMRLQGGGATSFCRKVLEPINLSDGTYLRPGTFVYAPTHALSREASIFPDPERFDGLRFYKLRKRSPAEANRHQFTTIDNAAAYFGAGRHACLGRNFADVLAKLIIATLIMKYDFKMIEGDTMPRDVPFKEGLVSINMAKKMMIRNRIN